MGNTTNRKRIIEFVTANPGHTGAEVAEALGLDPVSTATTISMLRRKGQLPPGVRGPGARPFPVLPHDSNVTDVVIRLRELRNEYAAKVEAIDAAIRALS